MALHQELITRLFHSFEGLLHREGETDFWLARELQTLFGYTNWRNFEQVVDKARTACAQAGAVVTDHFADVGKMVELKIAVRLGRRFLAGEFVRDSADGDRSNASRVPSCGACSAATEESGHAVRSRGVMFQAWSVRPNTTRSSCSRSTTSCARWRRSWSAGRTPTT